MNSELEELICEISQRGYCSGWQDNIEFDIWEMIDRKEIEDVKYGYSEVKKWELVRLKQIAEKERCWVAWSNDFGVVMVHLSDWINYYRTHTHKINKNYKQESDTST